MDRFDKTIIQLSTPYVISAIHIIRVSGKQSLDFLKNHTLLKSIIARKVYYTSFLINGKVIDHILCFFFKEPASYTGEDMLEIHCHGSLLVVNDILKVGVKENLILAERGEFTRRAFVNGKMDLTQAEALNTFIHTKSFYLKENSLKILERKSFFSFKEIKKEILEILAYLESSIEFPEEGIEELDESKESLYKRYQRYIERITNYFQTIKTNYEKGKKFEEGFHLAIMGRPNAGKSTLMNALLREERMLVSEIEGTTRDFVKESITVEGIPVVLYDMTGMRSTEDLLEKEGIEKSFKALKRVDWVLYLLFSDRCFEEFIKYREVFSNKQVLFYLSKNDLMSLEVVEGFKQKAKEMGVDIIGNFSLKKNHQEAVDLIEKDLKKVLESFFDFPANEMSLLNERQKKVCEFILESLGRVKEMIGLRESEEIVSEEIRALNEFLEELDLQVGNEEIYNTLFQSFCIGK